MKHAHKRGDSFDLDCQLLNEDGTPVDISGFGIRSQVRQRTGEIVSELSVFVENSSQGEYRLVGGDTTSWPTGVMVWDIEYTAAGGRVFSTETIELTVKSDITQ